MNTGKGRIDPEQALLLGQSIQFSPIGWSMYPLLIPGRDLVRVEPAFGKRPRRGDVALYRRDGDILVLHRVFRVRGDTFYAVGDNQKEIEGPLRLDQIRGYMTAFSRDGKARRVAWLPYRAYAALWLFLRPVRPAISRVVHGFKKRQMRQKGRGKP